MGVLSQGYSQIGASIGSGCAPLNVQFTAPAGYSTYYWEFDDGSSSILPNPPNIFVNPKMPYTVTFRECKTCPILFTKEISVQPKPSITLAPVKGCAPLTATLSPQYTLPTGISMTSIKYLFGDGNSMTSTNTSVSHTYAKGGFPPTIELTTSPANAGCDNSVTFTNLVKASELIADFTMSLGAGCIIPLTVSTNPLIIASNPISSYSWSTSSGSTSSAARPTFNFTTYGSHSIQLQVSDDNGCTKSISKPFEIKENDIKNIIAPDTVCINMDVSVSHDGSNYLNTEWNFIGATAANNTNNKNSIGFYSTPGKYTISVTTYVNGLCPKTISKKLVVVDPKILYKVNPLPLCNKKNTFTLTCTDSLFFKEMTWVVEPFNDTLSKKFKETVTYTIRDLDSIDWEYYKPYTIANKLLLKMIGKTRYGCERIEYFYDFIDPLIAHVAPTITYGCAPLKVGFIDRTDDYRKDTLVKWEFDYGDGITQIVNSFNDTIFHTYNAKGTYNAKVKVTNKYGCMDTTYITPIYVGAPVSPDFSINPAGNLCTTDNTPITLSSTVSSSDVQVTKFWADGFQCINQNSVSFLPNKTTGPINIKMEVSDHGCFSSITKMININGPISKFEYTQTCDSLNKVVFTNKSESATSYLWNFGGMGTSTEVNPTFYFNIDSVYDVTLSAISNSCPPSISTQKVRIQTPKAVLDKDTFAFCLESANKLIFASKSTGVVNDGIHSGYIWEFNHHATPNRTIKDTSKYFFKIDTVSDTVKINHSIKTKDTSTIIQKDTSVIKIKIFIKDTSIINNQVVIKDTFKIVDSLRIKDTSIIIIKDTVVTKLKDTIILRLIDTATDTLILTVSNFMNCISKDTAIIKVDKVFIELSPAPISPICPSDSIKFYGKTSSMYGDSIYKWKFGDGFSSDSLQPKHQYNFNKSRDSFKYEFYATNKLKCIDSLKGVIYTKKIKLTIDSGTTNVCYGKDSTRIIAISDTPTYKTWKTPFGIIKNKDTINQNYTSSGAYNYTVYSVDKSNANCKDTLKTSINVWRNPDLGIWSTKDTLKVLCDPMSIELNYKDTNNTTLLFPKKWWTLQNSSGTTRYNLEQLSVPFTKGLNTVTFSASSQFCHDTVVKKYKVLAPSGDLTIDKNDLCKGDTIVFTVSNLIDVSKFYIDFGDGSIDSISPIPHKYTFVPISGKTIAKAIFATNGRACEGTPVEKEVRIYEVFAKFGVDFNIDSSICFRTIFVKDSSKGANSYFWTFGDGTTYTQAEPGYRSFPKADTFLITLKTENLEFGCKDSFAKEVKFIPLPHSKPTSDTTCLGQISKIYQTQFQKNVIYHWTPTLLFSPNPSDTTYASLDSNLNFTVIAIDTLTKCNDTGSAQIMIIPPMDTLTFDTIIAPGADVLLPFTLAPNYTARWVPDSFLSCIKCNDPVATYLLSPIKYYVLFTDNIRNCFPDTSTYNIRIFPDILVNAPTAFTPNGDGFNDIYYARGFGIKKLTSFKIFNRWGQLLFFSQSEHDGWDGYYKGVLQPSETYFYTIEGESYIKGKIVTKEGNFMLLK